MYLTKAFRIFIGMMLAICLAAPAAFAAEKSASGITVTGHAETLATPDIAFITLGVTTAGTSLETVRQENDQTMRQIIDALTALGVPRDKISTSQFSLQPINRQQDPKEPTTPIVSGYRLQNTLNIAVEDLSKISSVIDASLQAGANQFQSLRFGLKNDSAIRNELLKTAVHDGKIKAGIIADSLGVPLGKLTSVVEAGRISPVYTNEAASMRAGALETPVEPGSIRVSVNVTLSFDL